LRHQKTEKRQIAHRAIITGIIARPTFVPEDIPSAFGVGCADGDDGVDVSMTIFLANDCDCIEGRVDGVFGVQASRVEIIGVGVSARART
jgi:hypothetical protein